ncbi:MAG: hypothetical protein L0221_03065, partial [Chloroflexi bacterium]|nr:hypothetical protein [Chloroflexota bacterium]
TDVAQAGAEAKIDARGLVATGWQLGDVAAAGSLASGRATFRGGVTSGAAKRASVEGDVDLAGSEQYRAQVALDHFDPKKVVPGGSALAGDLSLAATLEGRGFSPAETRARAELRLSPSKLGEVAVDGGRVDVSIADGRARIAEATITAKDAKLLVRGDVALRPAESGSLQYDLEARDLGPWLALAGRDGAGAVKLHGTARGNVRDLAAAGRIEAKGLRLDERTIERAEGSYDVRLLGGKEPRGRFAVKIESSRGGVDVREATATVEMAERRRFSVDLKAVDAAGRAHRLSGAGEHGPAAFRFRLADLTLETPEGPWLLARPVPIEAKDGRLSIADLTLTGGGDRRVVIDGALALRGRQALRLRVERFSLETLRPLLAGAPEMRGVIDVTADLSGTASAPLL